MTAQCIGCYQDTVFSGDFIAKEVYGVGDKGSGDTTIANVQTCLEGCKNISLRAGFFIYEAVWW